MPWKLNRTGRDGLAVLCALLSIWICAIILPKDEAKHPSEVMALTTKEFVLIIDPGHGGMDGGTSAPDGRTESTYNMEISLRLRDVASFLGVHAVMTREEEALDYPEEMNSVAARKRWDTRQRVDRINAVGNAVLFSIHQNYYPGTAPSGAQVLYAPTENSRILGERVQERIAGYLQPENRRAVQPAARDIYIMNHIHCPAVLVECGFLSNPQEAKTLAEEGYQIRLAMVLADSFLQFTEEIMT